MVSPVNSFLTNVGLFKAKRGRPSAPVGSRSPNGQRIKAIDGWKWIKDLSRAEIEKLESQAPSSRTPVRTKSGGKKYNFSKEEGVVRWNSSRQIKEISIRGQDGKIKPRKYVGKQRAGGRVTRTEIANYRSREVSEGRQKTKEGVVRVRDGKKEISIRDEKSGKIRYHDYQGFAKDDEAVSDEEVDRVKDYLSGEGSVTYPSDYSDLVPYEPSNTVYDTSKPSKEILEFNDNLPITKLLKKVSDLRYEIILSRVPGSKTKRPWFKGAIVKVGNQYLKVRHTQNISSKTGGEQPHLRRYVLSPSDSKEWKNRPLRILTSRDYQTGQVLKTVKTREKFVVVKTERVEDKYAEHRYGEEDYKSEYGDNEEDYKGEYKGQFAIYGQVLPKDKIEEAKANDPSRFTKIEARKKKERDRQERISLHQFKQGTVKGEDSSIWDALHESYELEYQDLVTGVQSAKDSLSNAKRKGQTQRTINSLQSKLESAEDKLENFKFDPWDVVQRLATDITDGYWLGYEGKVFHYQLRDLSTRRTTATPKMVRNAIKRGILRSIPSP